MEKQTQNRPRSMDLFGIQEEIWRLRRENQVLRDSVDMAQMAISKWKELPLKKHFDLVEMISALSEVEAAIYYVGLVLEEGATVTDRNKESLVLVYDSDSRSMYVRD